MVDKDEENYKFKIKKDVVADAGEKVIV